jgi:DNA-binding MarR family transcriptional regulator
LIGALLRVPWETVNTRMLAGLHARGFDDLTPPQLSVMQYPGPENMRPSELASTTRMTKQALNYLLGQMERSGYLTRDEGDQDDQRGKRIHLTDRGWQAARAMREIVAELEAEWSRQVGAERFDELRNTLAELASRP